MLRIQVLGQGMIPRGYGLAPHKQFFWADKVLIQTILTDSHLRVNMQHPADGRLIAVTRANLDKLWNSYSDKYDSDLSKNKGRLVSEVINKPKTLIDKNNDKLKNTRETPKLVIEDTKPVEQPKVTPTPVVNNTPINNTTTVEEIKKTGAHIATDKEFDAAVDKAINNAKNEIKKPEPVKNDQKKNGTDNKKDDTKKEENILRPINNPDNK